MTTLEELLDRYEAVACAEPALYRDVAGVRSVKLESAREALVQRDRAWCAERDRLRDSRGRWRAWAIGLAVTFCVCIAVAGRIARPEFEHSCESVVERVEGRSIPPCPTGTRTTYAPLVPHDPMPRAYGCMCPGEKAPWETQGSGR